MVMVMIGVVKTLFAWVYKWNKTIVKIALAMLVIRRVATAVDVVRIVCRTSAVNFDDPSVHEDHDDVIKWKHFPRYWPFVRGIHRSPVNSPHKGQWRGALMFTLICARINGWVNNREAGDLRRHRAHFDVIVMLCSGRQHSIIICYKQGPLY